MKLVVQRVSEAHVKVNNQIIGAIKRGFVVFLGIHQSDTLATTSWLVNKLIGLRVFADASGKMNLSLKDINGEVLIISQFTLYANYMNGRRPDFLEAAPPAVAIPIYEKFIEEVRREVPVQTGEFGADMKVSLVNDGPVTLILEKSEV